MSKNIVLCSDGTGNRDIKGRGTNVFKLFEGVDLNGHRTDPSLKTQLAFYDDGVGTHGTVIRRVWGGAAGLGLKDNVKELYRELSRVYDKSDSIYLFGFSRGAFTVRTLAGMIGTCGILRGENFGTARALRSAVDEAYDVYRAKYDSYMTRLTSRIRRTPDSESALNAFRKKHKPIVGAKVAFIGVWDTVDAVGLPFASANFVNRVIYQFKFPTQVLGAHVERAYHALSIDDQRRSFEPLLWSGPDPRIEQVWFSGVHSNVGGGYPKQGMSLVALDWMLAHAERCGLRLLKIDRELFRGHACVDDLLYDSRSGLGMFYRWTPRDIRRYCAQSGIRPCIHLSVAERIAHATDDYAPGNIPPGVSVTPTPAGFDENNVAQKDLILQHRAQTIEATIRTALGERYLLDEVSAQITVGCISYLFFVCSWALFVVSAVAGASTLLGRAVPAWIIVGLWASTAAGFSAAAALSRHADNGMSDAFSLFWQKNQKDLRAALKQAKAESKGQARDNAMDAKVLAGVA